MTRPGPSVSSSGVIYPGADSLSPTGFGTGTGGVRASSVGTTEITDGGIEPVDIDLPALKVNLNATYGQVWATPAASTTLTGTLAAWTVTAVDCTAGAGARSLPAANSVTAGASCCAKKADTSGNALTVNRAGSDLIFGTGSGATSKVLTLAGEAVEFVSNGVDRWTVRASDTPSGVLSATYAKYRQPTLIAIGDSTIKNDSELNGNGAGGSATASSIASYLNGTAGAGFIAWANAALGRPFITPYNAGISGERSDQFLTRLPAVLAMSPGWLFIGGVANDLLQNVPLVTIQANITAMLDLAKAASVPVVIQTALPNDNIASGAKTVRRQYNVWLADTVARARRGVWVFDPSRWIENPTSGNYASGLSTDGTHPNLAGAFRIGEALARFVQTTPLYVQQPALWTHAGDDANLLSNPIPTGSSGTASTGTSGTVATSWLTSRTSGAGTATASVVARTDGIQGNVQRLAIASGAGTSVFMFQQQISLPTPGTVIYGEAEVTVPGDWVSPNRLHAALLFAGGTGGFTVFELRQTGADVALGYSPNRTYRFRTPAVVVPTGPTAVQLQVYASADSGTIDLLGGAIRAVTTAGVV